MLLPFAKTSLLCLLCSSVVVSFPSTDCLQRSKYKKRQGNCRSWEEDRGCVLQLCVNSHTRQWCSLRIQSHEQVFPGAVAGSGLCPQSPVGADGLPLPLHLQRRWQPLPGELCQGGCCESMSVESVCTQVRVGEKGSGLFIHCKPLAVLSTWLEWLVVSSRTQQIDSKPTWQISCWNLTWSLLDFKVWLATQFHGLQLFIYLYSALLLSALLWCSELQREIQVLKSV